MTHVVFDLDGTLIDGAPAVVDALQKACTIVGVPAPAAEPIRRSIGLPLSVMIDRLLDSAPEVDQVIEEYRRQYPPVAAQLEHRFEGTIEVLQALGASGRVLAVATGKSQLGADRAVHRHGFASLLSTVRGSDTVARGKPYPDLLEAVLADLGARPEDSWMVGDTVFDLQMAREVGVHSCAVTWGVHGESELRDERPTAVAKTFAELASILLPQR